MDDADVTLEHEAVEPKVTKARTTTAVKKRAAKAREDIQNRCAAAGLECKDTHGYDFKPVLALALRCGRDSRWVHLDSDSKIIEFAVIQFEKWVFLSGYHAICSYQDSYIESQFRAASGGYTSPMLSFARTFGKVVGRQGLTEQLNAVNFVLEPAQNGLPRIEISPASDIFRKLGTYGFGQLTLKLSECNATTHDQALSLLEKLAGSLFFQIDLLSHIPLTLSRYRPATRRLSLKPTQNMVANLQYPNSEFDDAPLSLYWYGRSASGMPLLQFLAFYQVIEFYFPAYSKAEAQRRLRTILKDPTFRSDRNADIGRLLASISVRGSGAYGDERSQLRSTFAECVDPDALRVFLESDSTRKEFYLAKGKSPYQRLSLANPSADLRNDVSDRMYDIRCKIVHTKSDSGNVDGDLLLSFSKEADQLLFDIELAEYLAQRVLIAANLPLQIAK